MYTIYKIFSTLLSLTTEGLIIIKVHRQVKTLGFNFPVRIRIHFLEIHACNRRGSVCFIAGQ